MTLKIRDMAAADGPRFGADDHPLTGQFSRVYYPAVNGDRFQDRSFTVEQDGRPVAFVPATESETSVDYFGMPIRIFAPSVSAEMASAVLDHVDKIATGRQIRFVDFDSLGRTTGLSAACLARGFLPIDLPKSIADLSISAEDRRAALRRRFKSHANWGKKNIAMHYINRSNPDRSAFDVFQDFHLRTAGRVTRPQASWEVLFDLILRGTGELSIGRIGDEIVTALMVVDGDRWSYYATGVNDRDRFDKPMAHWPMVDAIERSAARGKDFFEIGDVPPAEHVTPKEAAIGQFKAGFATRLVPCIVWRSVP